jgi:signal transduction histidine kinase
MERMKDELLSILSHELRTPLTSIRASLGLVAGGVLGHVPAPRQRLLDIALSNADRLIGLVNDVLDMERLQAGQLRLDVRATAVNDVVACAIEATRDLAERAAVSIEAVPTEVTVMADRQRLAQVLTNLLSNAIKFSPRDGVVRVEVEVEAEDEADTEVADTQPADTEAADAEAGDAEGEGRRVRIMVTDHGTGIPQHQLEAIFERFRQADASDSRPKGGSGLGLAICRGIVQLHGGRLWAESSLNQGSTFYVELRCAA